MKVVAVISGGPDSLGYAAQWGAKGCEIYPLIFDYGQKGSKEIQVAVELSRRLGFEEPIIVDISDLGKLWRGTQLTDEGVEVERDYTPNVVVPIRNAVFLTIAVAYAFTLGIEYVIYGAHLDDIKLREDTFDHLYPDCTPEFQLALEAALNMGHFRSERRVEIWSPAREGLTKSENLRRTYSLIGDLIFETWSCYLSGLLHCGRCESCINRHKAFREARIPDGTIYESYPYLDKLDEAIKVEEGFISKAFLERQSSMHQ